MKPKVAEAIEELRNGLPGSTIDVKEDADGGAFVIVRDLEIGPFEPCVAWIGFHITWTYPDADVYPHFLDPAVRYVGDGEAANKHQDGDLPAPLSRGATMPGFEIPAVKISRRSSNRNADTDSPLQKLLRILDTLTSR